jgi:hypothetical protein
MKALPIILAGLFAGSLAAQTKIDKTVAVNAGQKIRMTFDYPELIRVSTWDKNEVSITGTASINNGENDDAFKLDVNSDGNTITVRNEIVNMNDLPHRITVIRDGQKTTFRNKAEWRKYKEEHGGGSYTTNEGVDLEIEINIKVPKNMETMVKSVYGFVEVSSFTGPLTVEATYGGIDATLVERSTGELIAETNYGHIYSNLDVKFNSENVRDQDFHTYVTVKPGTGPRYSFESAYGNVYLRKTTN